MILEQDCWISWWGSWFDNEYGMKEVSRLMYWIWHGGRKVLSDVWSVPTMRSISVIGIKLKIDWRKMQGKGEKTWVTNAVFFVNFGNFTTSEEKWLLQRILHFLSYGHKYGLECWILLFDYITGNSTFCTSGQQLSTYFMFCDINMMTVLLIKRVFRGKLNLGLKMQVVVRA